MEKPFYNELVEDYHDLMRKGDYEAAQRVKAQMDQILADFAKAMEDHPWCKED
jgi:hypothetical protein